MQDGLATEIKRLKEESRREVRQVFGLRCPWCDREVFATSVKNDIGGPSVSISQGCTDPLSSYERAALMLDVREGYLTYLLRALLRFIDLRNRIGRTCAKKERREGCPGA